MSGYTSQELKLHRKRTTEQIKKAGQWSPGNAIWKTDRDLILFYAQGLDSAAFRTYFHQETSFVAFDKAMEQIVSSGFRGLAPIMFGIITNDDQVKDNQATQIIGKGANFIGFGAKFAEEAFQ